MLFIDFSPGSESAPFIFAVGMLCGVILLYAIVKWNEVPSQTKKWSDVDRPLIPPPPLPNRASKDINVSTVFREIAKKEFYSNWNFQLARIYRKRQCELERLLEENNIPFEKLDYKEALDKAKQKIIF
jgi:hypothetical protein